MRKFKTVALEINYCDRADTDHGIRSVCGQLLPEIRRNGIKRGYWSPNKKQELVDRLAMYEDQEEKGRWIPISEQLPEDESYIIVSFENATMPDIARYEENDEGGTFYPGDDEKSYSSYGIFVNAWMPLPEPYREEQ